MRNSYSGIAPNERGFISTRRPYRPNVPKNMPYLPSLIKPVFGFLANKEEKVFSKLVFQLLNIVNGLTIS